MLSDPEVQKMASNFVAVKIDPAETLDAREHKKTRYVPELVVLDAGQNFITTIDARDPSGVKRQLADALAEATRRRHRR